MITIFLSSTGEILRCVQCSDEYVEIQTQDGESYIDGEYPSDQFYIANGAPMALPLRPIEVDTFNWQTKQWEDHRTLQDFKEAQWTTFKQAREAAINAPLVTPYGTFDSDARARTSITDAVLMLQTLASLGTPTTIDFTMADNSAVVLDTTQMVTVGLLLGQKTQEAHARARLRRTAIDAAATRVLVEAVVW